MANDSKNRKGFAALDAQIKKLRQLKTIPEVSAPAVAVAAKQEIKRQVRRQQGPDGKPWPKGKNGQPVLQRAGNAVRATAIKSAVVLTLDDQYARHHLGAVKGKVKREIIPTTKIPRPMTRAIERVVTGEFFAIMEPEK